MSKNTRNPQADSLFRQRYGHSPNIMSPNIHARRMIAAGRLAVELSSGAGIFPGTEIWGVTVLVAADVNDRAAYDLSQSFGSREEAESYIETLRTWRPHSETIERREVVPGGERLTMADGAIWFHPFNGGAPVREA